jgi:hypothetical protein
MDLGVDQDLTKFAKIPMPVKFAKIPMPESLKNYIYI